MQGVFLKSWGETVPRLQASSDLGETLKPSPPKPLEEPENGNC